MAHFNCIDDAELARQFWDVECNAGSCRQSVRREYVELVMDGEYARHKVRQIQAVIEEGRPWPATFPNAAALLGHFEAYRFRLLCGPAKKGDKKEFWKSYERSMRELAESTLPRVVETNFEQNILVGTGIRGLSGLRPQDRTRTGVQELLARELGGGDLITGLKVAFRMIDEGCDGGMSALRHRFAVDAFRSSIGEAKRVARSLFRSAADSPAWAEEIASLINRSSLPGRPLVGLDVVVFWTQLVEPFIDSVSDAVLPPDFS